jgi:hypothetical protein
MRVCEFRNFLASREDTAIFSNITQRYNFIDTAICFALLGKGRALNSIIGVSKFGMLTNIILDITIDINFAKLT